MTKVLLICFLRIAGRAGSERVESADLIEGEKRMGAIRELLGVGNMSTLFPPPAVEDKMWRSRWPRDLGPSRISDPLTLSNISSDGVREMITFKRLDNGRNLDGMDS